MTSDSEAQSEAPSVETILTEMVENTVMFLTNDLPSLLEQDRVAGIRRYHKDEILKNLPEAKAKINRLIVKAYINGFSDGKKIRQKYEVGDIGGNYRITERFRRVGKNIKYKVVCTLCGAPMFRYSNKFNLRHKDCGALSNNLSKEQLGEK